MSRSSHVRWLVIIALFLLFLGLSYMSYTQNKNQETTNPQGMVPPAGDITIHGTIVCLPHKDTSGPQTLECAYGLQDDQGRYYSLQDSDPMYGNISKTPMNTLVEVTGTFTPQEDTKYQSIGIIKVSTIGEPIRLTRVTVQGTYVCLPHKDTTGPQTDECATGILTDDQLYYALDFGLSSQMIPDLKTNDRITVSGVITPLEALSTNHWQKYPIEGIISVTDSTKKL